MAKKSNLATVLKADLATNIPLKMLAEMVRSQGRGRDTVLAHITPREAAKLKREGGSGTTNPVTGLPEFQDGFDLPMVGGGDAPGAGGPESVTYATDIAPQTPMTQFASDAGAGFPSGAMAYQEPPQPGPAQARGWQRYDQPGDGLA